jgi:hypothetical protein
MNVSGSTKLLALALLFGVPWLSYLIGGGDGVLFLFAAIGAWRWVRVSSSVIAKGVVE